MITPVRIDELRAYWPLVRPWIEEAAGYARGEWIAEDVYAEIMAGSAHLYVAGEDDDLQGCGVFREQIRRDGKALFIWLVAGKVGLTDGFWQDIRELAISICATKIVFESHRRGWRKRATRFGFKEMSLYVAEV